ncbi:MAG: hypothetical protein QOC84_1897 [Bradyrhizobium sp.]|nr:hypothetical protein [Bradyrhizobium sp.]
MKTLPIAFVLAVLGSPAHAQVSTPSVPVTLGPITVGPGIGPGTIGSGIGGLAGGGLSLGGLGTGIGATPGIGVTVTGGSGAGTGAAGPGLGGGLGFTLPAALRPDDRRRSGRKRVIYASLAELGTVPTTPEDVVADRKPLRAIPGTPYATVAACRGAIVTAAQEYNPVFATTASGGSPLRLRDGAVAPIQTKLIYLREDGYEVKQAKVSCRLTSGGTVSGLS